MTERTKILDAIKLIFPDKEKRINQLYNENEEFRMLCDDYLLCLDSFKDFKQISSKKQKSAEELQDTIKELEHDLSNIIQQ